MTQQLKNTIQEIVREAIVKKIPLSAAVDRIATATDKAFGDAVAKATVGDMLEAVGLHIVPKGD
jgi:hypothetical protein